MPGLRETLTLKETLEAATSEGMTITEVADANAANVWLEDHAPELAALVLDMGEALRHLGECRWDINRPALARLEDAYGAVGPLLARLDQLGKEQTDG